MAPVDDKDDLHSADTVVSAQPAFAGRFNILRVLGQGSAGAVYEVSDSARGGERVALKILQDREAFDENTLQRFLEELKVCQRVRHPNLVEAYDLLELKDTIAFSMELVEGETLGALMEREALSPQGVDSVFSQVLAALSALHSRGIVHRDVKLDNILVRRDGHVKLTDLGLVKYEGGKGLTRAGLLLGTAQYMPPEYIQRSQFDARGDLYSLGVVLYETLRRQRRMPGRGGNEIIHELLRTGFAIEPLPAHLAIPRHQRIIAKALQPDPLKRYQNADEMREAFLADDDGSDATARGKTGIQKTVSRVTTATDSLQRLTPAPPVKARPRSLSMIEWAVLVVLLLGVAAGIFMLLTAKSHGA